MGKLSQQLKKAINYLLGLFSNDMGIDLVPRRPWFLLRVKGWCFVSLPWWLSKGELRMF